MIEIGDEVEVINYGHLIFESKKEFPETTMKSFPIYYENEEIRAIDINPEIVGKKGKVVEISPRGNFSLEGIPEKEYWYSKNQLKKL